MGGTGKKCDEKAYRACGTCKGTSGKIWGLKPYSVLDTHYCDQTHTDLWLHSLVT